MVLTVPDFPACRPLIELRAPAKLLLYSTNKAVSTVTRMSPFVLQQLSHALAKVCPHLPHRCPGPTPSGGFLRMNALAPRLFHPITRTKLFGSPRLRAVSKEIRPKRLLSHFSNPSFTLLLCFIFTGFGATMISASCDMTCLRQLLTSQILGGSWPVTGVDQSLASFVSY